MQFLAWKSESPVATIAIVTPGGMDMFMLPDVVVVADVEVDDVDDDDAWGAGAGDGAPPPDEQAAIAAASSNTVGRAKGV